MDTPYRTTTLRTPTVKWEVYIKKYWGTGWVPPTTGIQIVTLSVTVNGSLAVFFALLWVALFVRVRRVLVVPTGFGSDP